MTTHLFLVRRLHAAVGILMNFSSAMFLQRKQHAHQARIEYAGRDVEPFTRTK